MDFTEVNTPSDLVTQNETPKTRQTAALEALLECDWGETKEVVELVLGAALDWHKEVGVTLFQEDESKCLVWAKEVGTLTAVLNLLKTVS